MLYKAHPRDRKAWISLVYMYAGHPKAEVDSAGPPYNSFSRLQATRDARDLGVVAASSDWIVAETQPFHSNSSDDLALKLRHDKNSECGGMQGAKMGYPTVSFSVGSAGTSQND